MNCFIVFPYNLYNTEKKLFHWISAVHCFDTTNNQILLQKLNKYEIRANVNRLIQSYLYDVQ